MRLTLSKNELLTHERHINRLWEKNSQRIFKHPLLLFWVKSELPTPPRFKILFSVSKKRFKRAHDRNRIKRLMREAFRHQKPELYEKFGTEGPQFHVALQYIGNELPAYDNVYQTLSALIERFTHEAVENS